MVMVFQALCVLFGFGFWVLVVVVVFPSASVFPSTAFIIFGSCIIRSDLEVLF